MVSTLLASFSGLVNVLALSMFLFIIYAILGTQLWKGVLHNRCVEEAPFLANGTLPIDDPDEFYPPNLCSLTDTGRKCAEGFVCMAVGPNPMLGLTGVGQPSLFMLSPSLS
jgi:hypothetical protein